MEYCWNSNVSLHAWILDDLVEGHCEACSLTFTPQQAVMNIHNKLR
jgi:hypothetical protein